MGAGKNEPLAEPQVSAEPGAAGDIGQALLEHLAIPAFLLGADLRILAWNAAARRVVAGGDALQVAAEHLACVSRRRQSALQQAVAACAAAAQGGLPPMVRIPLQGHALPLTLCVLGLGLHRRQQAGAGAVAMVLIHHPAHRPAPAPAMLRAAFELTGAQAAVAAALLAGRAPAAIAQAQAVSLATIRQHTKAIYRKLGVRSAQDLAALLHASPFTLFTAAGAAPGADLDPWPAAASRAAIPPAGRCA